MNDSKTNLRKSLGVYLLLLVNPVGVITGFGYASVSTKTSRWRRPYHLTFSIHTEPIPLEV